MFKGHKITQDLLLIFAFSSLLIPLFFAREIKRTLKDFKIDSSVLVVFLISIFSVLPEAFAQYTNGVSQYVDNFGETVFLVSPAVISVRFFSLAILLFFGISLTVYKLAKNRMFPDGPLLILALISLIGVYSNGVAGKISHDILHLFTLAILMLAIGSVRTGKSTLLSIAIFGGFYSILSASSYLLVADQTFRICRFDKCSIFGTLYRGISTNENVAGITVACLIPAVYLTFTNLLKYVILTQMAIFVLFTGSRSATIAMIFTLLVFLASRYAKNALKLVRNSLIFVALTSAVLPFLINDSSFFTGRFMLWEIALKDINTRFLWGPSSLAWREKFSIGEIQAASVYSVHNQMLDILYTVGFVGLALALFAIFLLIRRQSTDSRFVSYVVLLPIAAIGTSERILSLTTFDSFSMLALMGFLVMRLSNSDVSKIHDQLKINVTIPNSASNFRRI